MNRLVFKEMLDETQKQETRLYKWVRVDGQYRFIHVVFYETHAMLVDNHEEAEAAGTIAVNCDYARVMDYGSGTLKVGCSSEAEEALEKLFQNAGRELKPRW